MKTVYVLLYLIGIGLIVFGKDWTARGAGIIAIVTGAGFHIVENGNERVRNSFRERGYGFGKKQ